MITAWQKCRGCLEAEDSVHENTDAVSSYADWLPSIILPQKPLFAADICRKIRKRCAAFKSEDIVENRQARYQLRVSTGAAKRTYTRRLESCSGGSTGKLWQGTKSITNYRKDVNRAVIQGGFLPGNLDSIQPTQQRHRLKGPLCLVGTVPPSPGDTCRFLGLMMSTARLLCRARRHLWTIPRTSVTASTSDEAIKPAARPGTTPQLDPGIPRGET